MSLSIGIVGLPNVGKSTLFNALAKKGVPMENYPFCTIDPSVGVVAVPDDRLWKLSEFSKSKKTVPATMEFVDIAGLVKGASLGEGLGNKFLANIRETDAILEVVRLFEDSDVIHVDGKIDPLKDIETINLELVLADMETVSKRLSTLEKEVKKGDKTTLAEKETLVKIQKTLEAGNMAYETVFSKEDKETIKSIQLLTMKPILYALNKKAGGKNLDEMNDERFKKLLEFFNEKKSKYILIDANIEQELNALSEEEKSTFKKDLNMSADGGIDDLIKKSYELLGLMTYFTTGEDETRGWTIKINSTAPEAGTAIHTDFKDKFIRAEVIHCDDLLKAGSYAKARETGLVRTEGKEYIVKDGDVVEFRI